MIEPYARASLPTRIAAWSASWWLPAALLAGALLFAALQATATPAAGAGAGDAATSVAGSGEAASREGHVVRYFNRDVITLRGEFMGRDSRLRASVAEANIQRIVARPGEAAVDFRNIPQGMLVLLGGEIVTIITPADLDALHGQSMAQARQDIARRLGDAVRVAERQAAPGEILHGVLWALGGSVLAVLLLFAVSWVGRHVRGRHDRWLQRHASRAPHESRRQMLDGVRTVGDWVLRLLILLVMLVVAEEWLRFVLGNFGFTQPWSNAMTTWMLERATRWGTAIAGAFPGIVTAVIIFMLARLLTQTISMTFRGVQSGRFQMFGIDHELAEPTRKLVVAGVWLFAIAMAYPYLPGADTDAFKGLSVLVGLMVSLGASGIVGQAAGGFTILYSRTMSVGDLVRSGEVEGVVQQIGLFTTRIRTITGVEVSIPNTVVLSGQLHNFSRHPDGPGMWLDTGVTIGYDSPWRQVHRLLLEAAAKTPGIQSSPAPFVLQTALSDFYVEYRLRARVQDGLRRMLILSELHAHIQDAFNAAGVQIMSPNYEADPEQPKLVARAHWDGVPLPGANTSQARPDGNDAAG